MPALNAVSGSCVMPDRLCLPSFWHGGFVDDIGWLSGLSNRRRGQALDRIRVGGYFRTLQDQVEHGPSAYRSPRQGQRHPSWCLLPRSRQHYWSEAHFEPQVQRCPALSYLGTEQKNCKCCAESVLSANMMGEGIAHVQTSSMRLLSRSLIYAVHRAGRLCLKCPCPVHLAILSEAPN